MFTGLSSGHDDLVKFETVGVMQRVLLTGLDLQSGHLHYVSIKGEKSLISLCHEY